MPSGTHFGIHSQSLKDQPDAGYRYSTLAQQSHELVSGETFYDMWDTVTAAYLARPELYDDPTHLRLDIVREGFEQG